MKRDFTYIDDIVDGVIRVVDCPPLPNKNAYSAANPPYKLYNIGNNNPVTLWDFINAIETACGKKANKTLLPMQPGDVPLTYADIDDLVNRFAFKPTTSVTEGIEKFVSWYVKGL